MEYMVKGERLDRQKGEERERGKGECRAMRGRQKRYKEGEEGNM